jgi:hypothetical protein
LQRQFLDEPVRVRACRACSELSSQASDAIVIDLPDNAAGCLQWLAARVGRPLATPAIVICRPESADLEWPLRDAGVHDVFVGDPDGKRLARSCRQRWSAS